MDKALSHAIERAKQYARQKQRANKFFKSMDDSPESTNFTNGDPETIYSIAALYAQDVITTDYDAAYVEIEQALSEDFPNYV